MPFSNHLKYIQLLLVTLESVTNETSEHILVDLPLNQQIKLDPLTMLKFALQIDTNLEMIVPAGSLVASMSIHQMASQLEYVMAMQQEKVA